MVAAYVEDITETARALAARAPRARLDPPLLLALDEIANLTPLPSLPSLMAEGGGSGITTLAVLQSLAQARNRCGEHAADAIWDAATVKVVLKDNNFSSRHRTGSLHILRLAPIPETIAPTVAERH